MTWWLEHLHSPPSSAEAWNIGRDGTHGSVLLCCHGAWPGPIDESAASPLSSCLRHLPSPMPQCSHSCAVDPFKSPAENEAGPLLRSMIDGTQWPSLTCRRSTPHLCDASRITTMGKNVTVWVPADPYRLTGQGTLDDAVVRSRAAGLRRLSERHSAIDEAGRGGCTPSSYGIPMVQIALVLENLGFKAQVSAVNTTQGWLLTSVLGPRKKSPLKYQASLLFPRSD